MKGRSNVSNGEKGSALLIVFLLAAIIAISLYLEMPVVVFEAQRQKEQLLISRGEQYAHAVKLFRRKIGHYPSSIKDLEDTNRMRFLRQRYVDPFTGKDDWRLLHAAPTGQLIDSKVNPMPALGQAPNGANSAGNAGLGNTASFGNANGSSSFGSSGASSSFGNSSGSSSFGNSGQSSSFGNSSGSSSFGNTNGSSSFGNSGGSSAFGNANGSGNANSTAALGVSSFDSSSSGPETPVKALPQRAPAVSASGGDAASATPADQDLNATLAAARQQADANGTGTGAPGAPVPNNANGNAQAGQGPDQTGGQPAGSAANNGNGAGSGANPGDLKSSLGQPNGPGQQSGGFPAANGTSSTGSSTFGNLNSTGLAGVASKAKGHSIKLVNEQSDYSLWEFYYDPSKDVVATGLAPGGVQQPQNGPNGTGQGTGFGNSQSSFGNNQSSFGQSSNGSGSSFGSSFGQSGTNSSNSNGNNANGNGAPAANPVNPNQNPTTPQ